MIQDSKKIDIVLEYQTSTDVERTHRFDTFSYKVYLTDGLFQVTKDIQRLTGHYRTPETSSV